MGVKASLKTAEHSQKIDEAKNNLSDTIRSDKKESESLKLRLTKRRNFFKKKKKIRKKIKMSLRQYQVQ